MSLEQTIGNLDIRYANTITFVGSSNTMVDTTTGRIQTKGIQHNSNVITDISGPHGRVAPTLKKYPEIIFEEGKFDANDSTNTYVQAGYTVTASSVLSSVYTPWRIFDDYLSGNDGWATLLRYNASSPGEAQSGLGATQFPAASGRYGEYIDLQLPHGIKVTNFIIKVRPTQSGSGTWMPEDSPGAGYLYGSNNGTTWTEIKAFSGLTYGGMSTNGGTQETVQVDSTVAYKYLRLQATHRAGQNGSDQYLAIGALEYYGYEELATQGDISIDTTLKSVMNTPQTTGANVYVDGNLGATFTNQVTGPTPVGTSAPHDTTGKYWELNGTLTSNISVEANTFLEGDQPHAVSVWFNSSNLEANVSNTCVFSISDQEKLNSQNLDLQSNTWHNLTYAYQGEGGSKVTYLDGRKVAEDQAEDTFGDYPPFAMTGYSQGGYVVSASSDTYSTTSFYAWKAFNDVQGNEGWHSGTGNGATNHFAANAGGSVYDASLSGGTSSPLSGNLGDWIKLELPHKLVIGYVNVKSRGTSSASTQSPKDFKILGSNDDVNWDILESYTSVPYSMTGENHTVGATKGYKYIAFLVTRIQVTTTSSTVMGEIAYYGHRENDLVRLPDPTNVLKYPHVAFPNSDGTAVGSNVAPSVRGYVATTDEANSSFPIGKVFDERYQTSGSDAAQRWQTTGSNYPTNGGLATSTNLTLTTLGNGTTYRGNYIQLESPHKLIITKYQIYSGAAVSTHRPTIVVLVGSNTGNTNDWVDLGSGDTTLPAYSGSDPDYSTTATISNTGAYKYHRLIIRALHSTPDPVVFQVKYFGTGVDSVPIQIGGGNIDKVANFRVYDKFVGEDQALEIWDAQKDYFGRAKSQMVLQQGKLGVGTDAPQGRFSVADEPHNLEEFPPRAMTGYKNYFEGHGEFCASASSWYNQSVSTDPIYPWSAFNKGALGFSTGNGYGNNWEPATPATYSTSTGLYTGASGFFTAGIGGDWVQLELPYAITLDHMEFMPAYYNNGSHIPLGVARSPKDGHIMASNDGIIWISIYNWTGRTDFTQLEYTTFKVPETVTKTYKYFRVVWTRTNSTAPSAGSYAAYATAGEIKFFGTREQGQSVLHDGQLTLTKNLNVPRIGPALDADDTPRRDRLVVEYNTSTNPTFEGAVRDTSGRGLDGIINSSVTYDSTSKEFDFAGDNDWIESPALGWTGAQPHSVSVWIKLDVMSNPNSTSIQNAWTIRKPDSTDAVSRISELHIFSTGAIEWAFNGNNNTTAVNKISAGIYYHIVCVYNGGAGNAASSRRMWINGVEETFATVSSTASAINFYDTATFAAGYDQGIDNYDLDGKMSSIKLYDTALTAEEVEKLYQMGRCDEGHHVVNFSKTRVGIGLGDGEAPQAALDVRGRILREYNPGEVIEELNSNCDGSILMVQSGSYTMTDVTASQTSTATHAVINGSSINYTAPLGAKRVYYTFAVHWDDNSFGAITHFKIQVDGTDIDPSRYTHAAQYQNDGNHHGSAIVRIEYSFDCNASSNDTSNGKFTSWTSPKTIRVTWRHYGSAINNHYQSNLHQNTWWDGSGSGVSGTTIMKPHLTIRAIA